MAPYIVKEIANKYPTLKYQDAADDILSKSYDLNEVQFFLGGEMDLLLGIDVFELVPQFIDELSPSSFLPESPLKLHGPASA